MPRKLPSDATLEWVWPHLAHQTEYVSGLLHKMKQCTKENGTAFVRIGVTGTGQKPYYRIFSRNPESRFEIIYGSFYDNHQELENGFAATNNWSSSNMSVELVEQFYKAKLVQMGRKLPASRPLT